MTLQLIVFIVLALFIAVCSVLAVTTSRILRAATYLLFVLFGTAGIYFQLNYSIFGSRPIADLCRRHHGTLCFQYSADLLTRRQVRTAEKR